MRGAGGACLLCRITLLCLPPSVYLFLPLSISPSPPSPLLPTASVFLLSRDSLCLFSLPPSFPLSLLFLLFLSLLPTHLPTYLPPCPSLCLSLPLSQCRQPKAVLVRLLHPE